MSDKEKYKFTNFNLLKELFKYETHDNVYVSLVGKDGKNLGILEIDNVKYEKLPKYQGGNRVLIELNVGEYEDLDKDFEQMEFDFMKN